MAKLIVSLLFALLLALATTLVPFPQTDGDETGSVVYAKGGNDQGEDNNDQGEDDDDDQGEDD